MVQKDKDISEKLKEALKGEKKDIRTVIEELGLHTIKSRDGLEKLSIDMKTNELYVCRAQKHKILSYQKPLLMKGIGLLSYLAEVKGGKISGIFVGDYNDLKTFLELYKRLKE